MSRTALPILFLIALFAISCKSDDAKKSGDDKKPDDSATKPAPDKKPVADAPQMPPGAPMWVQIPGLGIQVEMLEGTKLEWTEKGKRAHLRVPPLMVNISPVDKFTGGFDKWNEKNKNLIKMITSEKTDDGWTVVKQVNSELHKKVKFEAGVRIKPAGTELSCGASMDTEELAMAVVKACKSAKPL